MVALYKRVTWQRYGGTGIDRNGVGHCNTNQPEYVILVTQVSSLYINVIFN